MESTILTTAQAAKILGVSTRTAQLWMENGALASWKTPGGHRRARSDDVFALVATVNGEGAAAIPAGVPRVVPASPAESAGLIYPIGENEAARFAAVERTRLVDSEPESDFDDLARLAAEVLGASIALITLLTPDRQWFKSHIGLDMSETPRSWAFCNYTVLQDGVFQVEDLSKDERFAVNPAVRDDPRFRFYAGAPLRDADGYALGSLCLIDMAPRRLTEAEAKILSVLASQVATQIKLRMQYRELRRISGELARRAPC